MLTKISAYSDNYNLIENWNQYFRACSSKGRIVILGRIVSASGQIFRSDFRPQDEIFRPGMPFRPLDEQAHNVKMGALWVKPSRKIVWILLLELAIEKLNWSSSKKFITWFIIQTIRHVWKTFFTDLWGFIFLHGIGWLTDWMNEWLNFLLKPSE